MHDQIAHLHHVLEQQDRNVRPRHGRVARWTAAPRRRSPFFLNGLFAGRG